MRVGLSGMFSTAVDVCALVVLFKGVGIYVTLAAFLAAIGGGIANFLVNKYWAFADRRPIELSQIVTFAVVAVVTGIFTAFAVHILAVMMGWHFMWAKAIAAALVFVAWTYPAQSKLVFAVRA